MITIPFEKFQGTGNDFIIIDHRNKQFENIWSPSLIAKMCSRHFGIGADGVILMELSKHADFRMEYYNADGHKSTMCGNGGRCILAFAARHGVFQNNTVFEAIDGLHEGILLKNGTISLRMQDVASVIQVDETTYTTDTGSPHYVRFCENMPSNVVKEGADIRYSEPYRQQGININFVREDGTSLFVATYERGVENETLSCGTGVTAAAISLGVRTGKSGRYTQKITTKGGELEVSYHMEPDGNFTDIWLTGPAEHVFSGEYFI